MMLMFYAATAFNADLGAWDVSQVTNMARMFEETAAFNSDLSAWDVSKVTYMQYMFYSATAFNAPLDWCVLSTVNTLDMFDDSACGSGCGLAVVSDLADCGGGDDLQ